MKPNPKKITLGVVLFAGLFLLFSGATSFSAEPTEVSGRLVQAVQAIHNQDYSEAVSLLDNYPEEEPLSDYSKYLLSQALMESENYQRALDVLEGISGENDGTILDFEKYYLRAQIFRGMGRSDRALQIAEDTRQFLARAEEKEKLYELEFDIASSTQSSRLVLRKAIDFCEAVELRFIGDRRDQLFGTIEGVVERIDFSDGQGLEDLYRYIELLINYKHYRKARSLLLRNMGNWEGSLRSKAYFKLAWLDGFILDFPEEARWTFSRLLRDTPNSQIEAKARYYLALFEDDIGEDYDLDQELLEVYREFSWTKYGKLAAWRAFEKRTKGAGLTTLEKQLEIFKSALSRSAVREANWELFYQSFKENRYSLALKYLQRLESFYEKVPPKISFWTYKTKERADDDSGEYLKLVGSQKNHPLNYYSLLAKEKGWSRNGFSLDDMWTESDMSLEGREEKILGKDLGERAQEALRIAIQLKNHRLYFPALSRLERIKTELDQQDYLFLKSQWQSLAGNYRRSLKISNQLLSWYFDRNLMAPLTVVNSAFPTYYGSEVERLAGKFGIPETLIFAVIRQESAFDSEAYSVSGARGLMQVMPATAKGIASDLQLEGYETSDGFEPPINIEMGTYYISNQVSNWGDVRLGLTAYHGGPGNLGDWMSSFDTGDRDLFLENVPKDSTKNYVKAVYRNYLVYKELL